MEISQMQTCTPRPGNPASASCPEPNSATTCKSGSSKAGADDSVVVGKGDGDHGSVLVLESA